MSDFVVSDNEILEIMSRKYSDLSSVQAKVFESLSRKKWAEDFGINFRKSYAFYKNKFCVDILVLNGEDSETFSVSMSTNEICPTFEVSGPREDICERIQQIVRECIGENDLKPLKNVQIGEKYRHYKGGIYTVISESFHTERDEILVNYHKENDDKIWSRPKEIFMDGRFQPLK